MVKMDKGNTVFDLISGLFAYVIFGTKNALISEPPELHQCGTIMMATTNKHIHKNLINELVV